MSTRVHERGKPCWRASVVSRESARCMQVAEAAARPLRGVARTGTRRVRGACKPGWWLRGLKNTPPGGTGQSGFESQVRKWNISGLTVEKSALVEGRAFASAPAFKVFEKNGCLASEARQCRERWGTCEPRRGCPHVLMWSGKLSTATRTDETPARTPAGIPGSIR